MFMETRLHGKLKKLPDEPGVYLFYDDGNKLIYVGKAKSLKKRIKSYFANKNMGKKTNKLVSKINDVKYIKVTSEFEALLLEANLIQKSKPFYNIQAKDDKSPIYIRITNGDFPIVELTRNSKLPVNKKDFIRGPFPSTKTTREILRIIRKIFPYCHHKNAKKPCLFVHLGLCPYPYANKETQVEYIKTILKIKKLLSGKEKQLVRDLTKEMSLYAKLEMFERADIVKSQLQQLEYLTQTYRVPRDYIEQPTLVDDITRARLTELKKTLGISKMPRRIECYDISNISGKLATGSMVVFTDGRPSKANYRKFKIKYKSTPDDFEMIREVLSRRFKNNWPDADLIIIDGGRGQLSAAVKIAEKYNKKIPMVSLAKKLEQIYTTESPIPISLPKESPSRQLVQALRDEAHRFAITYHRLLRSRQLLEKVENIKHNI